MIKLTKNELRDQQLKLGQLSKYLPTLQLKKAMLQAEVNGTLQELDELGRQFEHLAHEMEGFQSLLTDRYASLLFTGITVDEVEKEWSNIAGIDIPTFVKVQFKDAPYRMMGTPLWVDSALKKLRKLVSKKEHMRVVEEKKKALEKELREVSIRVNLFEKIMIPRTQKAIKRIRVFLGDQQLSAVSQAKVAKRKIEERQRDR
ncbi:MAG: V-type ATP synthase subunit D [Simkaniaceae bacterium]|nr:V-type ATP synthase subunit D [Simkaniaceae bacterium]